jgi:hypothetical protein
MARPEESGFRRSVTPDRRQVSRDMGDSRARVETPSGRGEAAGEEAAHRLGLSHSTVKQHLANARSKVGATTTAELVWILAPRLPEAEDKAQPDE